MTNQCEAFGTDTRKKLSNWLTYENTCSKASGMLLPSFSANGLSAIEKVSYYFSCTISALGAPRLDKTGGNSSCHLDIAIVF